MAYKIAHSSKKIIGSIHITASKSESNRALIIQALCKDRFEIKNLAKAEDTTVLTKILNSNSTESTVDIGHAGTSMRFLTAYFAIQSGTKILTGSERMKERPIGILVDALTNLGAEISYLEKVGFPPLKIKGADLKGGEIEIDGSVSSQFISALLLISPLLQNGLVIKFKGNVVSRPYINMTLKMMEEFRVYGQWNENTISVSPQTYHKKSDEGYAYQVDGDWSAVSYWYSIVALAEEADLTLTGLNHKTIQGDAIVSNLFSFFGVKTEFIENGIRLTKVKVKDEHFGFDFSDCPDLVQTVAVCAAALNVPCFFNGLSTLKLKETDRLLALQQELKKMGVSVQLKNDSSIQMDATAINKDIQTIATYNDHRMAMSFAPLALKTDVIIIQNQEVVKKSYPDFWTDLVKLGFTIEEVNA